MTSEALNHRGLVVEGIEDSGQPGDREELRKVLRDVHQPQLSAIAIEGEMRPDDRAEAHAVHIRHLGEVEDDFPDALRGEALNGVADHHVAVAGRDFPTKIQKHDVVHLPLVNTHADLFSVSRRSYRSSTRRAVNVNGGGASYPESVSSTNSIAPPERVPRYRCLS